METRNYLECINIGLLEFGNKIQRRESAMVKFAANPLSELLDIQLFQVGQTHITAKAILAVNNRLTDISEDAMKIVFSAISNSSNEASPEIIETILRGLEEGEADVEAIYKFYEVCRIYKAGYDICFAISGEGEPPALLEACYMANPEAFEKVIQGPGWEREYYHYLHEFVTKIFEENSSGKVIYQKLNELLTSKYPEVENEKTVNQ